MSKHYSLCILLLLILAVELLVCTVCKLLLLHSTSSLTNQIALFEGISVG